MLPEEKTNHYDKFTFNSSNISAFLGEKEMHQEARQLSQTDTKIKNQGTDRNSYACWNIQLLDKDMKDKYKSKLFFEIQNNGSVWVVIDRKRNMVRQLEVMVLREKMA